MRLMAHDSSPKNIVTLLKMRVYSILIEVRACHSFRDLQEYPATEFRDLSAKVTQNPLTTSNLCHFLLTTYYFLTIIKILLHENIFLQYYVPLKCYFANKTLTIHNISHMRPLSHQTF